MGDDGTPAASGRGGAEPAVTRPESRGIAGSSRTAYSEFSGGRAGSAPLTWAQRGIWSAICRNPPGHFNFGLLVDVPDVEVTDVVRAIGQLVCRYESLRTVIRLVDGEPHQVVRASGRLPVRIVEAEPDSVPATAAALREELRAGGFDHGDELPVRPGIVAVGGRARVVVLVYSHVAADGRAGLIVSRDLDLLLRRPDPALPPAGLQPLDIAREQVADKGRRTMAAVKYWTRHYRRIPPATFTPVSPPHDPSHQMAAVTSPALLMAAQLVAARHRTSTSSVLLAATAALVGGWTGNSTVAMSVITSNRFQDRTREAVGMLTQNGLFVLDLPERSTLEELIPPARRAALQAYRHASYDQSVLDRALEEIYRERGTEVNPYCCFNDTRAALSDEPGPGAATVGVADLRRAGDRTTFTWLPGLGRMRCRFCLRLVDSPGALTVLLMADTRCLPPEQIETFLRSLERMVVATALEEPDPAGLVTEPTGSGG